MSRICNLTSLLLLLLLLGGLLAAFGCDDDDDDDDDNDDQTDDDNDDNDSDDDDDDDDDNNDDNNDDNDNDTTPAYDGTSLLPGPAEEGYDADLEAKADRFDRQHLLFNCAGNGINADVGVDLAQTDDREAIETFLQDTDSWDFEAFSGKTPLEAITATHKVAGLYGGVGIAADAFRYGVLRDQNYPQEDIDRAREFLQRDLEALFIAVEITGEPGIIARGFCRTDVPGPCAAEVTTPLFDEEGNPLPEEKTNGTWREDNSADNRFPNYKWEDSCSRDMFIGWSAAFGALWEVIRDDENFDEADKTRLQQHASDIGRNLMVERTGGPGSFGRAFDLEIFDADGRTTFHGYINENAFDRIYLAWLPIKDGMYSLMSLGIVAALTYCSEDPVLEDYLYNELIDERELDRIAAAHQLGVNLGLITNFSATNMAMEGAVLAQRYLDDPAVREKIRHATRTHLYLNNPPFINRQPEEYAYSLYDFIFAASESGASAFNPMWEAPDFDAIERGVTTLQQFGEPPYWDYGITNCDEAEIESGACVLENGDTVTVLGYKGRNDDLICLEPIPQEVRPPSNYRWRSNPYQPNGEGSGGGLLPGVDFRYAYWYARWVH